jgi:hypothetical protein
MGRSYLRVGVVGWAILVGCGGNAASKSDASNQDMPSAGKSQLPGAPDPNGQGTGGRSPDPPPGRCSKVCVPEATFLFDTHVSIETLREGSLRVCRELTAECYDGELTSLRSAGYGIDFQPAVKIAQGPTAFFTDDSWQAIHLSWAALESPELRNGERFTVKLILRRREYLLLDELAQLEVVTDCAGTCLQGFMDLRNDGSGGAPSWPVGGAGGAGGEAGSPPTGDLAGGAGGAAP